MPILSIVIPTYRRPEQLARCLAGIARSEGVDGDDAEIVVVDDGSPNGDAVLKVVAAAKAKCPFHVIFHRQPNGGPASARKRGCDLASGNWISFFDDDCAPRRDWLRRVIDGLKARPEAMLGGVTVNAIKGCLYAEASQLLIDHIYRAFRGPRGQEFIASNNMSLPKAALAEIQSFDVTMPLAGGEDRDLCARWIESGRSIHLDRKAIVYHYHFMCFNEYVRQHFSYGRGAYHYHSRRARRTRSGIRIEPLRFYSDLVLIPFRKGKRPFTSSIALSTLLLLSQVANAYGFFHEKFRNA